MTAATVVARPPVRVEGALVSHLHDGRTYVEVAHDGATFGGVLEPVPDGVWLTVSAHGTAGTLGRFGLTDDGVLAVLLEPVDHATLAVVSKILRAVDLDGAAARNTDQENQTDA